MKKYTFDRIYHIKIFKFLSRFVNEADMLRMSEAQAFITLPTLISHPTGTNVCTSLAGKSRQGGVTCWAEAVKHLLQTYATPAAMC